MTNSHLEWEASPAEKYAERWLEKHGFEVKLTKRYQSKSIYEVTRDGIKDTVEIPYTVMKFKAYMEQFYKGWVILVEVDSLRRQIQQGK